ncbi:MAG: competence/damage-inducible protein A [Tannerellaceae bacterium]|nr:competence/damage-inducible protein A [Tannerellaceae bacterium]
MDYEIITIGDELLIGQVIDTNSAWIARELERIGLRVIRKTCVGDSLVDITSSISTAFRRFDLVIMTGGLGPTKDDVTLKAICSHYRCGMHLSQAVLDDIERLFAETGRTMNELTRNQAMVPDRSLILRNLVGTAPGIWFEDDDSVLVSLPGVPAEMEWLMDNEVIPRLQKRFVRDTYIMHHTISVSGCTESALAIRLAGFEAELPASVKLAYLPQPGLIRLRLSVQTPMEFETKAISRKYLALLEKAVWARGSD